ncbi:hypothetical protein [Cognatishimia activa]|uniref:PepSY domain-containing protein n=1 Tax=Cognatishimia activa TaxID=1715691 RepID=A0A975I6K8_9RHOB|nr:hypothetical protein [Cognatishimia activa]QTN35019.1 hypothetical protein HZ995_11035 [Cognatishimia activa]
MPASAAPTVEEIIAQLEAQGYTDVSVSRTWLGRIRIEAESGTHEREIVFNQRTGEILRDFWEELEDDDEVEESEEAGEEGSDDGDDSEDEDEGDDD